MMKFNWLPWLLSLSLFLSCSRTKSDSTPSNAPTKEGLQIERKIFSNIDSIERKLSELGQLETRIKHSEHQLTAKETTDIHNQIQALTKDLAVFDSRIDSLEAVLSDIGQSNPEIKRIINLNKEKVAEKSGIKQSRLSFEQSDSIKNTESQLYLLTDECYYVIASEKELSDHKIITKGFMRRSNTLPHDFDKNFFISIDKNSMTRFPINSHSAEILSEHPSDSFELIRDSEGNIILVVNDPERFWDTNRFLIIKNEL